MLRKSKANNIRALQDCATAVLALGSGTLEPDGNLVLQGKDEDQHTQGMIAPVALKAWLLAQAEAYSLRYLLAHADDGVIWGRVDAKIDGSEGLELILSHAVAPGISPVLSAMTLQQARLFGETAELLLWRDGDNIFHYRLLADDAGMSTVYSECYDEAQLLWGTDGQQLEHNFTLLRDGAQGFCHAVPLALNLEIDGSLLRQENQNQIGPRLRVRHYLAQDNDDPTARVAVSRLVGLS